MDFGLILLSKIRISGLLLLSYLLSKIEFFAIFMMNIRQNQTQTVVNAPQAKIFDFICEKLPFLESFGIKITYFF